MEMTYEPHKFMKIFLNDMGKEIALSVSMMNSIIPEMISEMGASI